jgi:hypothetical protein
VVIWTLADGLRRSTRDALYFLATVTWIVFQTISLYSFHYLYDGLESTELTETSPQPLACLYLMAYVHELFLYLLAFCGLTCIACGIAAICYDRY